MMFRNLAFIAFLLLATPAWATEQMFIGCPANGDTASTTSTEYLAPNGGTNWATDVNDKAAMIATAITLTDFKVVVDTAPGAGKSYTFTIVKAASGGAEAFGDTALSFTISDTDTSGSDTGSVSVSAGEKLAIKSVPSGTPAATHLSFAINFTPGTSNYSILAGGGDADESVVDGSNHFIASVSAANDYNPNATYVPFPVAGTLRNLYAEHYTACTAGESTTYTIYKNGSPTSLSVELGEAETADSDTSNTVSISAGDYVHLECTEVNGPDNSNRYYGCVFIPSTTGYFMTVAGTTTGIVSTATAYRFVNGGDTSWSSDPDDFEGLIDSDDTVYMKAMAVRANDAVYSGSITCTVWNLTQSEDSSISVVLSSSETLDYSTGSYQVTTGDEVCFKYVSDAATSRNLQYGIVWLIEAAAAAERGISNAVFTNAVITDAGGS